MAPPTTPTPQSPLDKHIGAQIHAIAPPLRPVGPWISGVGRPTPIAATGARLGIMTDQNDQIPLEGEYEPSRWDWVSEQIERYEASGGTEANTLRDTGIPIVVITMKGRRSGKIRKIALMRVEHDGEYAFVASKGGAPEHPGWYHNMLAAPDDIWLQDGPEPFRVSVHQAEGDERATWWDRSLAVFGTYAEYQEKTDREIPVLIATPA